MKTTVAIVNEQSGPFVFEEVDIDEPRADEVLVRIVAAGSNPTATFTGTSESLARLLTGRLGPEHTPPGTEVTGSTTLKELREVFPGY